MDLAPDILAHSGKSKQKWQTENSNSFLLSLFPLLLINLKVFPFLPQLIISKHFHNFRNILYSRFPEIQILVFINRKIPLDLPSFSHIP